ncbi:hypothetical protein O6H91_01G016400 [Diphasiastrum complanatum]|uniref:Uncharacterized protein n=1 Tax=Diphasiastrum complanatum TaxID=34168 RepID=A0ACC2ENR1_DIPCM|nr:hypothetical protein O6H91_01G016400 [Diphasiastrum complanatum]
MPAQWFSWTKTLACTTDKDQVYDARSLPAPKAHPAALLSGKTYRSSCSWSLSNLKDVVHGNTRVVHKSSSCSPQSSDGRSDLHDIASDVVLADPNYEFRLSALGSLSSLRPGTPRPPTPSYASLKGTPVRKLSGCNGCNVDQDAMDKEADFGAGSMNRFSHNACSKCGQSFNKCEYLVQHVVRHAVTELSPGDSSRNIVEIIFRTSWLKKEIPFHRIERILKVHNTQRTLSRFEEYRETVKSRANDMLKKHARCIADGNELLRFYGSSVNCSLGANGSSSLCTMSICKVCHIIRSGFPSNKYGRGIHTSATSGKAHDCCVREAADFHLSSHAMLVCRVIAGRMYKGSGNVEELLLPDGYDSVAGEVGRYSNVEDLYVFNPRAVLPCFVVIYYC